MEKLVLITPIKEHKEEALKFIQEFIEHNSNINGVGGLDRFLDDYEGWLIKLEKQADINTVETGKVPASTYFAIRETDSKIIGMINIRHDLNEYLLLHGGHIGYGVRPTERKKGYATEILRLGLLKLKDLGVDKALVTCDDDNIGSYTVIENNKGILENLVEEDNKLIRRYWIDII